MSAAEVYDYGATQATARFTEWVENAVNGADYLRDQLDGQLPELARLLAAVRDAQRLLGMLERQTEADLAEAVRASDEREPEVPGVGVLRLSNRKKQEWDSPRLFATVTARACAADDPEAAVLEYLTTCLRVSPTTPWKAGGLREVGLDPDEYRSTEHKGWSVRIVEPDA